MATITTTLTHVCSGGGHLTFAITGDKSLTVPGTVAEMLEPISDEDVKTFLKVIVKMARMGRTNAQARTLLEAGVTVTV